MLLSPLLKMLFVCLKLTPASFEQWFEENSALNELIFLLQEREIVACGHGLASHMPPCRHGLSSYSVPSFPPLQAQQNTSIESQTKPEVTEHSQRVKSTNVNFLTFLPPLLGSQLLPEIPGVDGNYFKEQFVFRSKLRGNLSHQLFK